MAQFEEATAAADAATAQGGANGRGGGAVDPADDRKAKVTYVEAIKLCVGALGREAMDGIVREEWSGASFLVRSIPALRPMPSDFAVIGPHRLVNAAGRPNDGPWRRRKNSLRLP